LAKLPQQLPIARGEVLKARRRAVVKSRRGVVYLSKWPTPTGVIKSRRQAAWVCNFKKIARMSKTPTPQELDAAKAWAEGTPWYYRDVIETALSGKLITYRGEKRVTTPTVYVSRSTAENVSNAVLTTLTPNTLFWDNNAFWNSALNPSRLNFQSAGLYLFGCNVQWGTNGSSYRKVSFILNGTGSIQDYITLPTSEGPTDQPLTGFYYFHAGDYLEVKVHQNSGGTRTALLVRFWVMAITPEQVVHP